MSLLVHCALVLVLVAAATADARKCGRLLMEELDKTCNETLDCAEFGGDSETAKQLTERCCSRKCTEAEIKRYCCELRAKSQREPER
ncbi:hypothetical protein M3Y99_01170300 [Aphelenchoides fujianensis]|nr:hypothetical protein M3Y99_01170300 [Aphelenchoides fujianensis]